MSVPAKANPDRQLISDVAMDIGKSTIEYIEIMYLAMLEAVTPTARISIRNHIHNEIIAALGTIDADEIVARLERRKADRRKALKIYRWLRKKNDEESEE